MPYAILFSLTHGFSTPFLPGRIKGLKPLGGTAGNAIRYFVNANPCALHHCKCSPCPPCHTSTYLQGPSNPIWNVISDKGPEGWLIIIPIEGAWASLLL